MNETAIAVVSASVSSRDTPRKADSVAVRRQGLCATPPKAILAGPDRLRSVIRHFHQRHEQREIRQTEAALADRTFNEEEEQSVLKQMIAAKRRQQGIPAPTDG